MRLTNYSLVMTGLAVAIMLLQACSSTKSEDVPRKDLKLKTDRLYTFTIAGNGGFIQQQFQQPGSDKVFFLDYNTSAFYMLNTAEGTFRQCCTLPQEIYEADGFTVDEKARQLSIFYPDSANVYSFQGTFVKTVHSLKPAGGYAYMGGQDFPVIFRNGKWYTAYYPDIDGEFKNPDIFKAPVEAELDLKKGTARLLPQSYPAIYRENSYGPDYSASRIEIDGHTHGFVFPHSDSIYICDVKTGETSVRFFGSKINRKLQFIPFKGIESLNETVFMDLIHSNPAYIFATHAPLAGYYVRELAIPPKKEGEKYIQSLSFFDRDLNYIGESTTRVGFIVDSSKGLLGIRTANNQLTVDKISW